MISVEELTLGAIQLLKDAKRLHWNVDGQDRKTSAGMWSRLHWNVDGQDRKTSAGMWSRLHWNVDGQDRKTSAGMWSFNKTDRGNIIICYSR